MPISSKKAQATMSDPICAQPRVKPAKRAKKSKVNTNVEPACSSFSRSLLHSEFPKETEAPGDSPRPVTECVIIKSEGCKADIIRKMPAFEETMGHLFGPHAKPKYKPRRRWELDTYNALFGPDGQMMMSEHPRHYDIFELHRDMRIRRRKQQLDDTHNELFGDTMLSRPSSSTSANVTHDRLFGENLESSESESPRQTPEIFQHWDVFEPYRGMRRRRQKRRSDAVDTHGELFGESSPNGRKPVKNPSRYTRKTPKIVEDVVYKHLQPLVLGDQLPPLRTGKAYRKSVDPPRNPLTGAGYDAPSRDSITMPDRPRVLKPAADGITVKDPHDRNPVTGDGMPTLHSSTFDASGRKQLRPSTACGAFTSQFVISDECGTPPADNERRSRKRPSDAHSRMFDNPRNPITDVYDEPVESAEPNQRTEQRQLTETPSTAADLPGYRRKRRVQPADQKPRRSVLAWGKLNGNVDDNSCFVGDPPMIRRAAARDAEATAITGNTAKSADTVEPVIPVLDVSGDVVARDGSSPTSGAAAVDGDYYYDGDDDDDDDDDDEREDNHSEVEEDGTPADRRSSM